MCILLPLIKYILLLQVLIDFFQVLDHLPIPYICLAAST